MHWQPNSQRKFLTDRSFKRENVPTIDTVYHFLDKVFGMAKYSAECIVLGQVLLNRFLGATGEMIDERMSSRIQHTLVASLGPPPPRPAKMLALLIAHLLL